MHGWDSGSPGNVQSPCLHQGGSQLSYLLGGCVFSIAVLTIVGGSDIGVCVFCSSAVRPTEYKAVARTSGPALARSEVLWLPATRLPCERTTLDSLGLFRLTVKRALTVFFL